MGAESAGPTAGGRRQQPRHFERVEWAPHGDVDLERWPFTVATHSPVLASLPGATLLELGDWGMRPATYDELEVVRDWRGFLDAPQRWLRHLVHGVGEE